jgi:hypothetical protein
MKTHAQKLELFSMGLMVFGVMALCQPWSLFLHSYGPTIVLAGLILFNIFSRIKPSMAIPLPGAKKGPPATQPNRSSHSG